MPKRYVPPPGRNSRMRFNEETRKTVKHADDSYMDCSDIFDQPYYTVAKRILSYIGQWPYQSTLQRTVRIVLILSFAFSLLIAQIIKLSNSRHEINILIECLTTLLTNVAGIAKILNFWINTKKTRKLLEETRIYWKNIRSLRELEILQEYGQKGRRITIAYIILINAIVTTWCATPLLTIIMDFVSPLNQSRPHVILFQADYKVDPDKYFYSILFHGWVVGFIGINSIIAIDTFYMNIAQHVCAMFDILRFRLENTIQEDKNFKVILHPDIREDVYYQQIVSYMKKHKSIIEYTQFVESSCEWCLLLVVGINMVTMACTGYQVVAKNASTQNILRFAFFTVAQIVHLYCNTLPGQWITDSSSQLSMSVYNSKWYLPSLRSRRLIILFLRRSNQPCTIIAGKMYVMSMENFASVLQTSMSYFTLLTSMQ